MMIDIATSTCKTEGLISVIIPVFNMCDSLESTLQSVIAQTYSDLEIVCVDDGSTDGSHEVVESWAEKDSRIRVVFRQNGGLSAARNLGLDVATGEYVAFLDAGDVLHRKAFEILLGALTSSKADVAVSKSFVKAKSQELVSKKLSADLLEKPKIFSSDCPLVDILKYKYVLSSACNKLYRRKSVGTLRFQEGIFFEDWPFVTKVFGGINRFTMVESPLYGYVMQDGSITRSDFSERKILSYVAGIESVNEYFLQRGGVPRAAQKRCAIASGMMLGKVWHSRAAGPELQRLALREFWRLVRERKILLCDVPFKATVRAVAMRRPLLTIWIFATVVWMAATMFFTRFYPVWSPDVVVRYGPMADAFAVGDFEMAFHPRFGVLFQVLTGFVRRFFVFDGLQACQCVATAFWAYSIIPLWTIAKRVFDYRTAMLCVVFLLIAPGPFGLALDGLRDNGRMFAMLICALACINGQSLYMALGAFILLTLRVDCYFIGTVLVAIWTLWAIARRQWRLIPMPVTAWLVGSAVVITMIHHYTGHWVPAVQLIKYVGGYL